MSELKAGGWWKWPLAVVAVITMPIWGVPMLLAGLIAEFKRDVLDNDER